YAPGGGGELWTAPFLVELARRLTPGGRLVTFSASARVRAALLAAGLEVFATPHTGRKGAGTVACRAPRGEGPLPADGVLELSEPLARKLRRRAERLRLALAATNRRSVSPR
ncbi:MAG: MnmC family methyltransferase, partial [Planctomycetota bacterium]